MRTTSQRLQSYKLGHAAEFIGCVYLQLKGYRILARRLRNACGEIDIIAYKKNCVVAVEVKARQTVEDCLFSITPQKKERTARALSLWMAHHKIAGLAEGAMPNMRFDVMCITPLRWPTHIKDAWR